MKRTMVLAYGLVSYLMFFAVFLYSIAFIGNLFVPLTLDGPQRVLTWQAVAIDLALLTVFAIQHSLMARPFFKRWLTKFMPQAMERSTYVLASNLAMIALFIGWQPLGNEIWTITNPTAIVIAYSVFFAGWVIVFISTCLISHTDLFGLRQVWLYFRGKPYTDLTFQVHCFYKMVRHPIYVGWVIVFWATPTMTIGHLFFAIITTVYIIVAIQLEERDLTDVHGVDYVSYKNDVPMLIPRIFKLRSTSGKRLRKI